jgi:hypothetical protein
VEMREDVTKHLYTYRVSVNRMSPALEPAIIPALDTKESVRVDLPWSTWAMTDMLRMLVGRSLVIVSNLQQQTNSRVPPNMKHYSHKTSDLIDSEATPSAHVPAFPARIQQQSRHPTWVRVAISEKFATSATRLILCSYARQEWAVCTGMLLGWAPCHCIPNTRSQMFERKRVDDLLDL